MGSTPNHSVTLHSFGVAFCRVPLGEITLHGKSMSKHETPMIEKYWGDIGGTLIEEFQAVPKGETSGRRLIDAIIIPTGPTRRAKATEVDIRGEDIICVQAKNSRLGMYVMGQAVFSPRLLRKFQPRSVRSVALVSEDDEELRALLKDFEDVEVVVIK